VTVSFLFNGYENNPIVKKCCEVTPRQVLTLSDLLPIILKLRHSRWAYENKMWSFIGDELRLYLASISDDFIYIDGDVTIENPEDIKMDCMPQNLNNGTYFRANRSTEWVKYYLNLYETEDIRDTVNYEVFKKWQFPIPTQNDIIYKHYFTSFWERYKRRNIYQNHTIVFDAESDNQIGTAYIGNKIIWHYYKGDEWILPFYE
jgi:hypothetical protein